MRENRTPIPRDEATAILRDLHEALRHPAFAMAVVLVLCGEAQDEKADLSKRLASGPFAESSRGR